MMKIIAAAAFVATGPRSGDRRLDPGGVSGRLVSGEHQRQHL
jgi:hypothetical protein